MTWQEFTHDSGAQRNALIFAVVLVIALGWLLLPSPFSHRGQPVMRRPPPAARVPVAVQAPAPRVAAAPVAAPGAVPAARPAPDPLSKFRGNWFGHAVLPNRGTCRLSLELRTTPGKEGAFSGVSSLSCGRTLMEVMTGNSNHKLTVWEAQEIMRKAGLTPTSASVTGTMQDGVLLMNATDNIGVSQAVNGCDMVSMALHEWGEKQLSLKWQETQTGVCQGGEMVMSRR